MVHVLGNSRNRVSVGWGYLRLVQVISGRFRLVQVVSACCCLRLIQVGSGWLRAQNVRPGKVFTAIKCGGRQRPLYVRILLKNTYLTCRNVILTLQEKTWCGCGVSGKRLATWSSSSLAVKIGERIIKDQIVLEVVAFFTQLGFRESAILIVSRCHNHIYCRRSMGHHGV